ncbi:DUF190 domain-containing protein [Fretibacter rubidus]|uniref:DUF190 domain-containing protein n=1 Tax=Fretibacter rubidus TaxID=570162 RepID=UPI00352ACA29
MDMHPKKRLELIIETPAQKRAERVLTDVGVTGYTVVPAMAGYGGHSRWRRGMDISSSRDMVVILSIMDEEKLIKAIEVLGSLLGDHIGVVSVSDVSVVRKDIF